MKLRVIFSEGSRNFATGTSRSILVLVSLVVVAAFGILVQVGGLVNVLNQANAYRQSGAAVQVMQAEEHIDPKTCDALSSVEGINAAGAFATSSETLTPATLPQNPIPLGKASLEFVHLLDITAFDPQTAGVYISQTVSNRLGKTAGDTFLLDNMTEVSVKGVYNYPEDGRQSGLSYLIIAEDVSGALLSNCWAEIWPQNDDKTSLLWTTLSTIPGEDLNAKSDVKPAINQLNARFGARFTDYDEYTRSWAGLVQLFVLLLAALLGFVFTRIRRVELSSALHIGVKKPDLLKVLFVESIFPLIASAFAALLTFLVVTYQISGDKFPLFLMAARLELLLMVGFIVGEVVAGVYTQKRHFFKYFKER